jgi:hypothetical protein
LLTALQSTAQKKQELAYHAAMDGVASSCGATDEDLKKRENIITCYLLGMQVAVLSEGVSLVLNLCI